MKFTIKNFIKHMLLGFVFNPGVISILWSQWIFENFSLSDSKFWTNIGTSVILRYSKFMLFELIFVFIISKAISYFTGYNKIGFAIWGGLIHAIMSYFLLLVTYISLYYGGDSLIEYIIVMTLAAIYGVFFFPRFLRNKSNIQTESTTNE